MVSTRRGKANCLVIGGAGFLGQHLVRALLQSGNYQVCGMLAAMLPDLKRLPDRVLHWEHALDVPHDVRRAPQCSMCCQTMCLRRQHAS